MNSKKSSGSERRGFALLTVIMLTLAMAALAASAVYMAGNAGLLATSSDREREFKYGAEAAMAMGKSRLNTDPLVLPDTGFVTVMSGQTITGADGVVLPGVSVNLYVGPTGSSSGQFGRFASVVAEARDASGARFVRRLELTQESFARFAYWSNDEGASISFGNGDNLWGPVWSNDDINILSSGAKFHGEVGTAKTITGKSYGTFDKGYLEHQPVVTLPTNTTLSKLAGYAASGGTNIIPVVGSTGPNVLTRIEFVAVDLGTGGTDSTGADEGFVKVYRAKTNSTADVVWMRGGWTGDKTTTTNCGASYKVTNPGTPKFFPASAWGTANMKTALVNGGMTSTQANAVAALNLDDIMKLPTAHCYLGGDPHLSWEERKNSTPVAGDSLTWTNTGGQHGDWLKWNGPYDARLQLKRPNDYQYLIPLYRGLNAGTKGVIAITGSVGVSGVLRGRVTLYATDDILILDDLRYATDPSLGKCLDMLGLISSTDVTVADNSLNDPPNIDGSGTYRNEDDTKDLFIHGVIMALNTSFGVQNSSSGPSNANDCDATNSGRGCLYLNGGLIQKQRGAVGQASGQGFVKRYTYDRCAVSTPPPYFPTTGRYLENRYYEIDPVRFDVTSLFAGLTPN